MGALPVLSKGERSFERKKLEKYYRGKAALLNKYLDHVSDLIRKLGETQGEEIEKAAILVSDSIESGGIVHTFGTGHSALIAQEIFVRAGGIVPVNAILDPSFLLSSGALRSTALERTPGTAASALAGHDVREGDVAIIISNSGKNHAPIEIALLLKEMGIKIIAITSLEHTASVKSSHKSKKRLFEVSDVVLDNMAPKGDASIVVEGIKGQMGAVSGIIGSLILHSVIIEAASILAKGGKPPAVFVSVNVEDEDTEGLAMAIMKYKGRIKHL
jgi:uncharacterized phosphosugar-binding protein